MSDPAARTLDVQVFAQRFEQPVHHIQQAGQREHEHQAPDAEPQPPFAQVGPKIKQIAQPEHRDQKRENIRADSENKKRRIRDMRAERPDPIVHRIVYRYVDEREIIAVEGKLSDQQRQRHQQQQRDPDDIVESAARIRRRLA